MKTSFIALIVLAFLLSTSLAAPTAKADPAPPSGPYFGQKPPGEKAVVFAPGAISVQGRAEFALSFSPDGKEILFTAQDPNDPAALYHTRLEKGRWSPPGKVSLSGGRKKSEMEGFFTPDGKRIYFAAYDEGMDVRIWAVDRGKKGWHRPRQLGSPIADAPAFFPTSTSDGAIYYTNLVSRGVFRATLDGDTVKKAEDAALGDGMHAFVAPDESFVVVDARSGEGEQFDIFVLFRRKDGSWTAPVSLGAEVNTEYAETCPALSHDGKFLFFSRYNEENEIPNIYWISSAVIDKARKRSHKAH